MRWDANHFYWMTTMVTRKRQLSCFTHNHRLCRQDPSILYKNERVGSTLQAGLELKVQWSGVIFRLFRSNLKTPKNYSKQWESIPLIHVCSMLRWLWQILEDFCPKSSQFSSYNKNKFHQIVWLPSLLKNTNSDDNSMNKNSTAMWEIQISYTGQMYHNVEFLIVL